MNRFAQRYEYACKRMQGTTNNANSVAGNRQICNRNSYVGWFQVRCHCSYIGGDVLQQRPWNERDRKRNHAEQSNIVFLIFESWSDVRFGRDQLYGGRANCMPSRNIPFFLVPGYFSEAWRNGKRWEDRGNLVGGWWEFYDFCGPLTQNALALVPQVDCRDRRKSCLLESEPFT